MAKFVNTRKAVSELEELIREAGDKLVLISPYLKLSKDFRQLLEYRNNKDLKTTIVFGKQELKPEEMRFLQGLRFVILRFNEDLHAKCYVNDDKMVITSLNLYEFSMANNREMGVLIDRTDPADVDLFSDAMKEVEFILDTSQRFDFAPPPPAPVEEPAHTRARPAASTGTSAARSTPATDKKAAGPTGYCIRTGVEIPFNLEMPMCADAYRRWSKYEDTDYAERYCHFSGEPSDGETSFRRPILRKNWKKAQAAHGI